MTGDGIKQIYHQMENELRDLSTDNSQPSTGETWEPPSLERIKKRMGMMT
ncbi:hypothetical protein [Pedosphaera parvula]|uniref:Uncharacterized protein n=1 Tax=Pedosphaera parvula (strain Ellin514) TaxID=320771 RepID=B9XDF6_PEDPL|nr:hypothetical protein [Pedosphaera parvula]EEF62102.1 hypothetical protein Cflav_PD6377 [Pedosphaera parvula Ellin514]